MKKRWRTRRRGSKRVGVPIKAKMRRDNNFNLITGHVVMYQYNESLHIVVNVKG